MAAWGLSCTSQLAVRLWPLPRLSTVPYTITDPRDSTKAEGRLAARPAAMDWWISGKTFLT